MAQTIEEKRAEVAAHDRAERNAAKAVVRAQMQPLVDAGFGAGSGVIAGLVKALNENAGALGAVESQLQTTALTTATILTTIDDKIRSILALNQEEQAPIETPPP